MDNEIIENVLNFEIICMNIFQSHLFVSNIEKHEGIDHVCLVIDYTKDNAKEKIEGLLQNAGVQYTYIKSDYSNFCDKILFKVSDLELLNTYLRIKYVDSLIY
ncbi:MAG: hypothetical protein ACI4V7_12250 [Succinivibrionaceae bacterium]